MADDLQSTPSGYDPSTGRANVDESVFESSEEGYVESGESTQETTQEPTTTTEAAPSEGSESQVTEAPTEDTETPTVYAGKYNNLNDLKAAFYNLGGDPEEYQDPKELEIAYKVAEREFTRSRQRLAEQEKVDQPQETKETPEDFDDKILDQVNWDKVENARDLGKELLKAFKQMLPQQQQPTEEQLVERIMPAIQEREARQKELTDLETRVPRLTKDSEFRTAFAFYIQGQKQNGTFRSLDTSMKGFLKLGESLASEANSMSQQQEKDKLSAFPSQDKGEGLPTKDNTDETDDILDAYEERKNKFSL